MTDSSIIVTKLDAARRQLNTAIKLYFEEGDPISIHTLTCAAYNIVRDLIHEFTNNKMHLKDLIPEEVKPEFKKEIRNNLNEAENYFKHADRDSQKSISFNPKMTELFLFDSIKHYIVLTREGSHLFQLFRLWFFIKYRHIFIFSKEQELMVKQVENDSVSNDRKLFKKTVLPKIIAVDNNL